MLFTPPRAGKSQFWHPTGFAKALASLDTEIKGPCRRSSVAIEFLNPTRLYLASKTGNDLSKVVWPKNWAT